MRSLETYRVDDWGKFISENNVDLSYPCCHGNNCKKCRECGGSGYIEPMWDTIWNSGYCSSHTRIPTDFGGAFAFMWDERIWFGLSRCGMDCTPYLARAWRRMFPECHWLPEQFMVEGISLREGYLRICLGELEAREIHALIAETIRDERYQMKCLAADLRKAMRNLARMSANDSKKV